MAAPAATLDSPAGVPDAGWTFSDNKLIADIPFLTVALIFFLMLIFGLEKHFAFDIGRDGTLTVRSLIAFGAISRDLVVGSFEWWRVALAPLLHASVSHLVGNSIALFFVGIRLEPMIGRGWFLIVFIVSALGGVAGSLIGNPPAVPSVGASGAITGLIGALFAVSFNHRAEPDEQRAMRKTSLRFGVPALLPLAFGASGGVDYFAHAGGALAGGAVALAVCAVWAADTMRPKLGRITAIASATSFAAALLCGGVAAAKYQTYAATASQFVRMSEIPANMRVGGQRSADLLHRYPKDPLSHLLRAIYFADEHRYHEAELELRITMTMATDAVGGPIRRQAKIILAAVVAEQGRMGEAKTLASDACHAADQMAMRRALQKAKLCE